MLGYDSIPSLVIEITPPSAIRIAMTHAKIGRSMKKLDMLMSLARQRGQCALGAGVLSADVLSAFAAGASGCHGVALAGAPGFTFITPETMIWSPSVRPSVTIQSDPRNVSALTRFCATLPSAPTTST